jgi:hypothetical protein
LACEHSFQSWHVELLAYEPGHGLLAMCVLLAAAKGISRIPAVFLWYSSGIPYVFLGYSQVFLMDFLAILRYSLIISQVLWVNSRVE